MPRRHSRAHTRHHFIRVALKRRRKYLELKLDPWYDSHPLELSLGRFDNEQPHLGCHRARCGVCNPTERWHRGADRLAESGPGGGSGTKPVEDFCVSRRAHPALDARRDAVLTRIHRGSGESQQPRVSVIRLLRARCACAGRCRRETRQDMYSRDRGDRT